MKILSIIESAYRGTLEEQDDTVIWTTTALRGAGADIDILLVENAVNYAVKGQDASGLTLGAWKQTQPPRIEADLARIMGKGASVYLCADDAGERGLNDSHMIDGVQTKVRSDLPELFENYDQIWYW